MEASRHPRCEFQGLLLGSQCAHTARACCKKSTTDEVKGKRPKNRKILLLCILTSSNLSYRVCGAAFNGGRLHTLGTKWLLAQNDFIRPRCKTLTRTEIECISQVFRLKSIPKKREQHYFPERLDKWPWCSSCGADCCQTDRQGNSVGCSVDTSPNGDWGPTGDLLWLAVFAT